MALKKVEARGHRHARVRKKVSGTAERPRLAVFRSNKHIYAQLIDDVAGRTLVAASALDAEATKDGKKQDVAKNVGALLGKRAKEAGISGVIFDRGGYRYHGRVAQVAAGAREAGLTL
ncbi:MAG: 50S ribosomal protein L18 [Actinobacteria bacterium]|nr:MAG: 50S ribosomal protein L18 [Actinomycetota bacterium]